MKADVAARDHRPIYIQVAEGLRARILSGYYKDKIDGELKLVQEWKVSRRTIQQALDILVQEGLLGRQQGTGTFINHGAVAKRYRAITSITDGIRAQGLTVDYRVLGSGPEPASAAACAFFGIEDGASAYRHVRLVLGDGRPLAVTSTLLNLRLLGAIELAHLDRGLYDTLRRSHGRTVVHAEDAYRPVIASAATAGLLGLPPGSAIFLAERRAWDQEGAPIELSTVEMLPVPLEISISQVGTDWIDKPPPVADPWDYRVGFGDFKG
ncbi:UTRA domain-containing protein [Prosthecomicrobium pneumaticum]|uniref:GntR family transcriptional regulator n=1 Tax=Prosthecomicrobium pneumaticum TaxID=81895 RepID=A0A7W9FJM9_9HYPH|nr:GntR family transcriptional regulator [Prosthecomicrobium pneumaticum]